MKQSAGDDRMSSALHLLHRAGQCADEMFAFTVGEVGLTPRQYAVMAAIAESDEPSQTTLVERTGIDRSTMADIVRRLTSRGLVQRRRTRRDARRYAVRLTDKGEGALRLAEPAARSTDERLLSALPATQRDAFLRSLARIVLAVEPETAARGTRL
jgi:DNA-binding MarR family transcriptional regulator